MPDSCDKGGLRCVTTAGRLCVWSAWWRVRLCDDGCLRVRARRFGRNERDRAVDNMRLRQGF